MIFHILLPVIAALVVNGVVYAKKWNNNNEKESKNKLLPPGWAVGLIWTVLFALLGYLHYTTSKRYGYMSIESVAILLLVIFCLAYPFLTKLQEKNGRLLNVVTLVLVSVVMWLVPKAWALLPLLIWASYVNIADAISQMPK
jgi:tryptophan-rich sensory protein